MAVLIKEMGMPKNCDECPLNSTCVYSLYMPLYHTEKRHSDCPLIEVPEPHGRLIDADALPWYLANEPIKYASYEDWERLCDAIKTAPTVIPASEEG